jgi:putative phosphoribosyl transferase
MRFANRTEAGKELAAKLQAYAHRDDVIVLALPRGGVPVGYEVARLLDAPLDVFIVRKLGVPGHEELAMGAIATGGVRVLNEQVTAYFEQEIIEAVARREEQELKRREQLYRGDRPFPDLSDRTVILVDDGLATGATMRAGVVALRQLRARRIVAAVPVAEAQTCDDFRSVADEVVCAVTPEPFIAVGAWYLNFSQTSDEEVQACLERARLERKERLSHASSTQPDFPQRSQKRDD